MQVHLCFNHLLIEINSSADVDLEELLTLGHPLQWDLTFSSMIPTAASFASTDLTTPFTSFPAASGGPASVLSRVRLCLRSNGQL